MQNVQRVHNVQNMQNVVNMQNISFPVFLLRQQMLSFSKYFPPFPSPNIFLLFLFRSSSPISKCHEVQSPMSRFNIVDLFSPRNWSNFFLQSALTLSPISPFPSCEQHALLTEEPLDPWGSVGRQTRLDKSHIDIAAAMKLFQ